MIRLTISRPNTIGVFSRKTFETYSGECEEYIERYVENRVDRGWDATEIHGSTSKGGIIELTHDNEADIVLIQWETLLTDND